MSAAVAEHIAEFAKSNPEAAREIFNAAIANVSDPDQIAKMELCREYFCNADFQSALHDYIHPIAKALC